MDAVPGYNIFDTVANVLGVPETQDALVLRLVEQLEANLVSLTNLVSKYKDTSRFTRSWAPCEDRVENISMYSRAISNIEDIIANS